MSQEKAGIDERWKYKMSSLRDVWRKMMTNNKRVDLVDITRLSALMQVIAQHDIDLEGVGFDLKVLMWGIVLV